MYNTIWTSIDTKPSHGSYENQLTHEIRNSLDDIGHLSNVAVIGEPVSNQVEEGRESDTSPVEEECCINDSNRK